MTTATKSNYTGTTYTVEKIPANQLEVDRRVQRDDLNDAKIRKIEAKFNPDALGVIFVSRRKDRGLYIIDGWHRTEVAKRKDPDFELTCHVFEGLTVVQEAHMFLDLNTSSQPTMLERYKVSLSAEDPDAMEIEQITTSRGWKIHPIPAPSHIQAIGAVYRIHELSKKVEAEPHLLDATLFVITRAWGVDQEASQAVILEGIARVIAKYGDRMSLNTLYERLRDLKGGARDLHRRAQALADTRNGRVTNAVAELVVVAYNKNARGRALPAWGQQT